jgi:hypothetical protein
MNAQPATAVDRLATFLDDAHHNARTTMAHLRLEYGALAAIDRLYCEITENLNHHPALLSGFFLIRSHSSFRGGVQLALGGLVAEAYMLLRGCLESALYGLYVAGDIGRQETWLRRHEDATSRRNVQREFTVSNVMGNLRLVDARTHGVAAALYERTIDLGGHPNERAVSTQVETISTDAGIEVTARQFQCGDVPHRLSLKSAVQVGICGLDILFHVFRERYRILGIDLRLDQLRQRF